MRIQKALALALFLLSFPVISHAQSLLPGQWSFGLQTGYNITLSSSLNGTWSEFRSEENRSDEPLPRPEVLPFGESTYPFNFGVQLAYRFKDSPISLYAGMQSTYFWTQSSENQTQSPESAALGVFALNVGSEYTFGEPSEMWNFFGRGAVNFNGTSLRYPLYSQFFSNDDWTEMSVRYGFEAEAGSRFNIPSTPLALEASVNYTNPLITGKGNRASNEERSLDFISFRLGARVWM
jgi:hypothetical protein